MELKVDGACLNWCWTVTFESIQWNWKINRSCWLTCCNCYLNPFNGIESKIGGLNCQPHGTTTESIQWNWKEPNLNKLVTCVVAESIQWNWKSLQPCTKAYRSLARNPFNGIERDPWEGCNSFIRVFLKNPFNGIERTSWGYRHNSS